MGDVVAKQLEGLVAEQMLDIAPGAGEETVTSASSFTVITAILFGRALLGSVALTASEAASGDCRVVWPSPAPMMLRSLPSIVTRSRNEPAASFTLYRRPRMR
jgi:hypothetical protein